MSVEKIPTCENLALGWYKRLKKIGTRAMNCVHLCLWKTLSQDCPHGEIRQLYDTKNAPLEFIPPICAIIVSLLSCSCQQLGNIAWEIPYQIRFKRHQ